MTINVGPAQEASAADASPLRRRSLIQAMGLGAIGLATAPVAQMAFASPESATETVSGIRTCTQLFPGQTTFAPLTKGADQPGCLWKRADLKVRFLEGDPFVQDKVRKIAAEWTQYTGIPFVFGDFSDAEIRIAFGPTGSWSYVGSCQYDVGPNQATMNFGWLDRRTPDLEYRRVVLHEFGHAMGMVHEHQNPASGIQWNEPAVYDYYWKTQRWNKEKTYQQVIQKYSQSETNYTSFDPNSIMEYPIPKALTLDGFEVGWNLELSELDKRFMMREYGRG